MEVFRNVLFMYVVRWSVLCGLLYGACSKVYCVVCCMVYDDVGFSEVFIVETGLDFWILLSFHWSVISIKNCDWLQ